MPAPRELDFDPRRLDAFLRAELGLTGAIEIERIAGGQSNPSYFVSGGGGRFVLRKKPAGAILPSAHAVDREHRVMAALAETGVPVPAMVLYHADPQTIGTPFFLMQRLDGRVFHDSALPGVGPADRAAMYRDMAATLAKLHAVDWAAVGLGDYGRPDSYFERQVGRWTRQWQLSKTRHSAEIDELIAWLPDNIPPGDVTTIVHGDFRLGNLMFHPTEPKIVGVLDWELSTLGHPLADLAHSAMMWRLLPAEFGGVAGLDLASMGIPTESEYERIYHEQARHRLALQPFHIAFALFRFAVIFEGIASRAAAGNASAANAREVGTLSQNFARRAVEAIGLHALA